MPDLSDAQWNAILSGAADSQGTTDSSNPFYSAVGQTDATPSDPQPVDTSTASETQPVAQPAPQPASPAPASQAPAPAAPVYTLDDMKAAADALPAVKDATKNDDGSTSAALEHKDNYTLDDMKAAASDLSKPDASSDYPMPKDREFANEQLAQHIYQYDQGTGPSPDQRTILPGGEEMDSPPLMSERAAAEGITEKGASTVAQYNAEFALGNLDPTDPEDTQYAKEAVAKAIANDTGKPYPIDAVRVGPSTHQMEWKPDPTKDNWDLFQGSGPAAAMSHIVAAFPDFVSSGTETLGAMAGGAAGTFSPILPGVGSVMGGATGAGFARAFATYTALKSAKARGVTSMDDDEIFKRSVTSGVKAAGTQAVGGAIFGAMRRVALGISGYDAALSKQVGSWDKIKAGLSAASGISKKASAFTGKAVDFPIEAGQAAGAEEALNPQTVYKGVQRNQPTGGDSARAAADALMKEHEGLRGPIADKYERQATALQTMQEALFKGEDPDAVSRGGQAMKAAISAEQAKANKGVAAAQAQTAATHAQNLQTEVEGVQSGITARSSEPTRTMLSARNALREAKSSEFDQFRDAFDQIESHEGISMNLDGFRQAAARIRGAMTQGIVKGVGVQGKAGRVLAQSENAGIPPELLKYLEENTDDEDWGDLVEEIRSTYKGEPQSLADVLKLQSGLKAAARDAAKTPGRSQEARIFNQLDQAIDATLNENVPNDVMDQINNVRAAYRSTITKYNAGKIGAMLKDDGRGTYSMADNAALDSIMDGATSADSFMRAIFSPSSFDGATGQSTAGIIPRGGQILRTVQQAVMGRLRQRFVDRQTGRINNPKGFQQYLNNNHETLERLFNLSPDQRAIAPEAMSFSADTLHNVAAMARNSKASLDAVKAVAEKMSDKYGIYDGSPSKIIDLAVSNNHLEELPGIRAIISKNMGPEGVAAFSSALSSKARSMMADQHNIVTADGVDKFLASDSGKAIAEQLGPKWTGGLKTVGDMLRIMEQQASPSASNEISERVTKEHAVLRGFKRMVRIFVPPLSEHSRILTAGLGYMGDKARERISQIIANPARLEQIAKNAASIKDPFQAGSRRALANMGLQELTDIHDSFRRMGREGGPVAGDN